MSYKICPAPKVKRNGEFLGIKKLNIQLTIHELIFFGKHLTNFNSEKQAIDM